MKDAHDQSPILAYHAGFSVALYAIVGIFANSLFVESASGRPSSRVFLMLAVVALGQMAMAFRRHIPAVALFAFFLSDALVTLVLVRSSGASASPFLVLFPLLSLAGAIIFPTVFSILLLLFCLLLQSLAVGFGPAIAGNILATLATTILGFYLVKALARSGVALRISEGQRRRLENLQRAILKNIPSGLMSIDPQGRVIQINDVGLRILGLSENEVLLRKLSDFMPIIDAQVSRLNTLVPSAGGFESPGGDRPSFTFKRNGGETLVLGYSLTRLSDPEDGTTLGSLLVFQDLTAIVKMEENLRLSEKLAAVGKLAAGIAHEIRNPLAGISGSAQLLTGAEALDEEDRRLLSIIQREATRLDLLITEFLEYVRPQKPKIEVVNLLTLAQRVSDSMRVSPKWKDLHCEIKIVAHGGLDYAVQGDENKIIQSLMNLILNAGQAGASRVELRLGPRGAVDVVDNGKGISAADQKRLFEPFFTTKESGTGLGLATSYRALEAMGAHISVRSPVREFAQQKFGAGSGTIFSIQFRGVSHSWPQTKPA